MFFFGERGGGEGIETSTSSPTKNNIVLNHRNLSVQPL